MPHSSNSTDEKMEPIAIIGLACRFPGDASTAEGFWDLLQSGRSAYSDVPRDRYNIDAFHDPTTKRQGTITAPGAHFLSEDVSAFDAPFFSLTANEARAMDPQQRLLLEVSYEAFENAGLPIENLPGSATGCFVGCFTKDYAEMMARDPENVPQYNATGTSAAILSNRLSWFYDLRGPSLTLDTACSSTLVALHLACQSLQTGETKLAVVGGTNIILNPDLSMALSNLHMLAKDGLSKAFDERANGYGRGEGIATVILKPLSAAIKDGDCVRAIIRGTGVNQDGKTPGITLPSSQAQEALIRSTYLRAGLDFADTSYFEAHGTGTPAGDPLELGAISRTFGGRKDGDEIIIGSLKTNVGHLEGSAGIAGIIKAVMMLEKGIIPRSIHFNNAPATVNLKALGVKVSVESTPWPRPGVRRMSINSFGFGGTNGHAILEDAGFYLASKGIKGHHRTILDGSNEVSKSSATTKQVYIFSATEQESVIRVKSNLSEYINKKRDNGLALDDLAFTLAARRSRLPWKGFAIASSADELLTQLSSSTKPVRSSAAPRLAFVFTGQGAQWARMGVELMQFPIFAKSVEASEVYLKSIGAKWSATEELNRESKDSRIVESEYSQPLCSVLQIALVDLLESWNVRPVAVVGHSSGEIGAAYCLGALSAPDCLRIAYFRGLYSSQIQTISPDIKGSMMAVGLSESEGIERAATIKSGKIGVAAINAPTSVTMSGDSEGIDELYEILNAEGIFARKLNVENAYHSHHMEIIAEMYYESIKDAKTLTPHESVQMFSSVSGKLLAVEELGAAYWVKNLVSPVRFSAAVNSLLSHGSGKRRRANVVAADAFLEVGPHPALRGPVQSTLATLSNKNLPYHSLLERGKSDVETTLKLTGTLFTLGSPIDISEVNDQLLSNIPEARTPLVDLQPYPFNHSQTFWHESRLSKDFRFRKHARTDLLGVEAPNFNPLEPEWRNIVRVSTHPWIRDHTIQQSIIYPAAGLILMVIEAARQIADPDKKAAAFNLRDVRVGKAVVIPDNDVGVEIVLKIRSRKTGSRSNDASWLEFTIFSSDDEKTLSENCSGLLSIEYVVSNATSAQLEKSSEDKTLQEKYETYSSKASSQDNVPAFYTNLAEAGLSYGPFFQTISQIRKGDSYCCSRVGIPDWETLDPDSLGTFAELHPATLDCMFQTAFAGFGKDYELREAMVPILIASLSVSCDLPTQKGTEYIGFAASTTHGFREINSDIIMWDPEFKSPKVSIKGFCCTKISASPGIDDGDSQVRKIVTTKWSSAPDIGLLHDRKVKQLIEDIVMPDPETLTPTPKFELAAFIFLKRAISKVSYDQVDIPHLKLFYQWMENRLKIIQSGSHSHNTLGLDWMNLSEETQSSVISEVRDSGVQGLVLCLIGESLEQILTSQIAALEILLKDDLLYRFYRDAPEQVLVNQKLIKYLELATHKDPSLSILEIGGGSGGTTFQLLSALGGGDGVPASFGNYTFTDVGPGFVSKAEDDMQAYKSSMSFKLLDIEKDPLTQGFEATYDVVIAANVLHATQSIVTTLENTRKLLKPGGKLCLIDMTNPLLWVGLIFGNISGWWLGETDGRHGGPLLSLNRWDGVLKESGFTGVDLFTQDTDVPADQQLSLIVATVPKEEPQPLEGRLILLEPKKQSEEQKELFAQLASSRLSTERITWDDDISSCAGAHVIVLLETAEPFLDSLSEQDFTRFKNLIDIAASTLWVTNGDDPRLDLVLGLSRTLRNEMPTLKFRVLQIREDNQFPADIAGHIYSVAAGPMASGDEVEFELSQDMIKIARIIEEREMNDVLASQSQRDKPKPMTINEAHTELKLDIGLPGSLDSLCFIEDTTADTPLGADEVELKVKASGLNFRDVMVAMGQIPDSTLGFEASGLITRVGTNVANLKEGDRVFTITKGSHRSTLRTKSVFCQLIPESMSFVEAAAVPLISCTVYQGLVRKANIKKGDTILIHSAAGGVGQAAIQLAKHYGAEIYATIGSKEKKALIMDTYGIPEDHIFNSRDLSFAKGIKRMTNGRGVDIVLNSLAGEALRETWLSLAPFGTFIEIGIKDILANSGLDMLPFLRDVTFASVNLEHIGRERPAVMGEIMAETQKLIEQGAMGPVTPLTAYPVSELEDAFRTMQAGKHLGKIVLTFNDDDVVPVVINPAHPLKANQGTLDGTVVLVGCLGGLGRSLAKFLVKHGAKHLAFISRSGAKSSKQQKFMEELLQDNLDARVYLCDVANLKDFQSTVAKITAEMPPIIGAVNGAMALEDSIFNNMSYERWIAGLKGKLDGSWNLHSALPQDLEFFIMLSSHVGVYGNRGQANYSAGCTFQDALCRHRRSKGLKAVSLDLGIMLGIGYVSEAGGVDALRDWECFGVNEVEFHAFVKASVTGKSKRDVPVISPLILGLATGGGVDAAGIDTPYYFDNPQMSILVKTGKGDADSGAAGNTNSIKDQLLVIKSLAEATKLILEIMIAKVAKNLRTNVENIEADQALHTYGVDSLVAVELRNWVLREIGADISLFDITGSVPIAQLAERVALKSQWVSATA